MSAAVRPGSGEGRKMKDHLASWRLSAYPGANARRRKVIGGRIYDDGGFLSTDHRGQPVRKMREANGSVSTDSNTCGDSLCPRNLDGDWRRSHSCRKMVRIACQGELIADRYRPDGEPHWHECRSESRTDISFRRGIASAARRCRRDR